MSVYILTIVFLGIIIVFWVVAKNKAKALLKNEAIKSLKDSLEKNHSIIERLNEELNKEQLELAKEHGYAATELGFRIKEAHVAGVDLHAFAAIVKQPNFFSEEVT
jgi:hypothetical protein